LGAAQADFNVVIHRPDQDLIDLVGSEARELKGRFGNDKFFELKL
jgi:hypothetical protein